MVGTLGLLAFWGMQYSIDTADIERLYSKNCITIETKSTLYVVPLGLPIIHEFEPSDYSRNCKYRKTYLSMSRLKNMIHSRETMKMLDGDWKVSRLDFFFWGIVPILVSASEVRVKFSEDIMYLRGFLTFPLLMNVRGNPKGFFLDLTVIDPSSTATLRERFDLARGRKFSTINNNQFISITTNGVSTVVYTLSR